MASQGPNACGTGANDAAIGVLAWAAPTNIQVDDANGTGATGVVGAGNFTNWLKATNFGFSIPAGATIDGIVVEWDKLNDSASNNVKDHAVRIVKGGVIGSTDRSDGANWPTTYTFVSHGSSSDLWGETWTDTDVNASTFGAVLAVVENNVNDVVIVLVDHCRITVYYTEVVPGGGGNFGGVSVREQKRTLRPGPFKPGNPR